MKDFWIFQNCSICGEGFDSEYKLLKHINKFHPQPERGGWVGGGEDSCSCGHHTSHQDG